MANVTSSQVQAAFQATLAIAEAIRELGEVPNGELYAQVMSKLDLDTYQHIISTLKRSGLVTETANLLKWVGPLKGVKA